MLRFASEPPSRWLNTEATGLVGILLIPAAAEAPLCTCIGGGVSDERRMCALPGGGRAAERNRYTRAVCACSGTPRRPGNQRRSISGPRPAPAAGYTRSLALPDGRRLFQTRWCAKMLNVAAVNVACVSVMQVSAPQAQPRTRSSPGGLSGVTEASQAVLG